MTANLTADEVDRITIQLLNEAEDTSHFENWLRRAAASEGVEDAMIEDLTWVACKAAEKGLTVARINRRHH